MKLYNSLTNSIQEIPNNNNITLYVCGVTPYDTTHLGHAFTYLLFDVLIKYLRYKGFSVTYTQNVTDIDDDILRKAKEAGWNWKELGDFWINRFLFDLKALNVAMPTYYVRATETMDTIKMIITGLIAKKHAYIVDEAVYFDVTTFPQYGMLSKYSPSTMRKLLKERGGNPDDPKKKHPLDFILWQKSLPNEPSWKSSWSNGRPGWHIECSAMIYKYLGEQITIHGGGSDLIFPHHESELAQSESYTGRVPFVWNWMHIAMVSYHGEKMSKSLGNLVLVANLLKTYSPNTIRYTLLSHHYRKPWEFMDSELPKAEKELAKITQALSLPVSGKKPIQQQYLETFEKYMDNDFNTPSVLRLLSTIADEIRSKAQTHDMKETQNSLKEIFSLLGLRE